MFVGSKCKDCFFFEMYNKVFLEYFKNFEDDFVYLLPCGGFYISSLRGLYSVDSCQKDIIPSSNILSLIYKNL